MTRDILQMTIHKHLVKDPSIKHTTAEKLKAPEYSVDKSPKKPSENPDLAPKNNKR